MIRVEPKWLAKWRELERLVDKKYEGYISVVGLQMKQFNEAATRSFSIDLIIRNCNFFLGDGNSRLRAIAKAINTVKDDDEFNASLVHFSAKPASATQLCGLSAIINECKFKKTAP